jgi:hypothetical protein
MLRPRSSLSQPLPEPCGKLPIREGFITAADHRAPGCGCRKRILSTPVIRLNPTEGHRVRALVYGIGYAIAFVSILDADGRSARSPSRPSVRGCSSW